MLESLAVSPAAGLTPSAVPDLGLLTEAMVFYGRVRLFGNHGLVSRMVEVLGADLLIEFLEHEFLELTYVERATGVVTTAAATKDETHRFTTFSVGGWALEDAARRVFSEAIERPGKARRTTAKFLALVGEPLELPDLDELALRHVESGVAGDHARQVLAALAPEYTPGTRLEFNVHLAGDVMVVDSNIDWAAANASYHRRIPPEASSLSPAFLLSQVIAAQEELFYAATCSGDLAVSRSTRDLVAAQLRVSADRVGADPRVAAYQREVTGTTTAVRDAVNSGARSPHEAFELVRHASRFRQWIEELPGDADLITAYFKEVAKGTWAERLPARVARWAISTAAGIAVAPVAGPVVGAVGTAALGLFDQVVLERLVAGWRPNMFIDDHLLPFATK